MKTRMKEEVYVSPQVEILEVEVEKGFAQSVVRGVGEDFEMDDEYPFYYN